MAGPGEPDLAGGTRRIAALTPTEADAVTDLLLPRGTHLIHIGSPKTGSTALQFAMYTAAGELRRHGVYYASLGQVRAQEAGWAVVGGRAAVGRPTPRMDAWHALVAEVREARAERVVVSNEDFARATADQVRAVVSGIGGSRPHVVLVVRRLDRVIPSHWQERVKAREARSYERWLEVVLAERSDDWSWRHMWSFQDVEKVTERWGSVVGRENMTLVVADEESRATLPATFEQLLGLPDGTLRLVDRASNRSLSLQEAEMLRRLNVALRERDLPGELYARLVQGGVVTALISHPRPPGHTSGPTLPGWAVSRVEELARHQERAVRNSGARVVGDPASLSAGPWHPAPISPPEVAEIDLETVVAALDGVISVSLRMSRRAQRRLRRLQRRGQPSTALENASARELAGALGARAVRRLRRGS